MELSLCVYNLLTVCVCVCITVDYRLLCFVRVYHRVQELLAIGETSESSIDQPKADTEANGELNPDSTEESTVKKKKKKTKIKEKPEEEVADFASIQLDTSATELNEDKGTGEKKKKRKKHKHVKQEEVEEEVQISAMEVHGSDSSGYQSEEPSKKRKCDPGADISSVGEGPEPKKSKKRKSS